MRLLIVSNRLLVTVREKDGDVEFVESAGGLVSGLSAYLDSLKGASFTESEYLWLGWPGSSIRDELKERVRTEARSRFRACPVFLTEAEMDDFYHGFCNKTIWPLFHYFPSFVEYEAKCWDQYVHVNEIFRDAVLEVARDDDLIWIHDYHLMLLPKMIRERRPGASVGFFLHIPFPSYEIFRLLPDKWRRRILEGLLGADLIGFHTQEYTQYFLRCVLRMLGYEHDIGLINMVDHVARAETFPMGIDFEKYNNAAENNEVIAQIGELQPALSGQKVVLSIDRLDYTKGILNRLRSYELLLEENPDLQRQVILVLVLVPSRIGVDRYQQMKKDIDELISRINGKFGSVQWTPILYQYKYLSFEALAALYNLGDVCLVTPLRDGMNLVAKEYIAARRDRRGVLILSEMAGSAKELGEALIVNPNNVEEIARALKTALEMPSDDAVRNNEIMQRRIKRYNVARWAGDFIEGLKEIKRLQQEKFYARHLNPEDSRKIVADYNKAQAAQIFLDYDGTLVPFYGQPVLARPPRDLLDLLISLTKKPGRQLVIVSGRDRSTLQNWFGPVNAGLVAEHGVWIREPDADWQMIKPLISDWKPKIRPILEFYTDRLPGSFIEEKEHSVVWHFRRADPELGSVRSNELVDELVELTANTDVQILQGSKVVEIRNAGVNKGVAAMRFLHGFQADFILAIGDDWTDEDLFKILPARAYSIRVGMVASHARFNLWSYREVIALLEEMAR